MFFFLLLKLNLIILSLYFSFLYGINFILVEEALMKFVKLF